jgi:Ca2+-binding RTX toxin-like protein
VSVTRNGADVILDFGGGDTLTLQNFDAGDSDYQYKIDRIDFTDVTWMRGDLVSLLAGNDTYVFNRGDGQDTVYDYDTTAGNTDVAQFGAGIAADQLWFRHVGSNLEIDVIGTSDSVTISNWYSGTGYQVEQIKAGDGLTLLSSQVDALVQAMAQFAPPAAGQMTLPTNYQTALNPVLAANWK